MVEFIYGMSFLEQRDVPVWLPGSSVTQRSATSSGGSCEWCNERLICLSRCSHLCGKKFRSLGYIPFGLESISVLELAVIQLGICMVSAFEGLSC